MIEIIVFSILVILIFILLLLRLWLPLISKQPFVSTDSIEQRIDAEITIMNQIDIKDEFSLTSLGLSKKFKLDVILETMYLLDKRDKSKFYYAELNILTHENVNKIIEHDEGFFVVIECLKNDTSKASKIDLYCSNESYDFVKTQIKNNKFMTMSLENGKLIKRKRMEELLLIKARKIDLNFEDTTRSTYSLREFVKRYENNSELIKNLYLKEWLNHIKLINL